MLETGAGFAPPGLCIAAHPAPAMEIKTIAAMTSTADAVHLVGGTPASSRPW